MEDNRTYVYDSGPIKAEDTFKDFVGDAEVASEQAYGLLHYTGDEWVSAEPLTFEDHTNGALELYHNPCDLWMQLHANTWELYGGEGENNKMMVSVDLNSGDVTFADDYEPDEAAKSFWNTMGHLCPSVEESYEEYEQAKKDLVTYKQLFADVDGVLRQVRHALGVPEGESIVEHAKLLTNNQVEVSAPPGIADDMPDDYMVTLTLVEDEDAEHLVGESALEMVEKAYTKHKFDDALKVID